jgi:DNA primase
MNPTDVARELKAAPVTRASPATGGAGDAEAEKSYQLSSLANDPVTMLERDALMVLLQHAEIVDKARATQVLATQFSHGALALVRDAMMSAFEHYATPVWVTKVTEETPQALSTLVGQLAVAPLPGGADQIDRYCMGVTATLLDRELLRKKAELLSSLQRSNPETDSTGYRELQEQLVELEKERRDLRGD